MMEVSKAGVQGGAVCSVAVRVLEVACMTGGTGMRRVDGLGWDDGVFKCLGEFVLGIVRGP